MRRWVVLCVVLCFWGCDDSKTGSSGDPDGGVPCPAGASVDPNTGECVPDPADTHGASQDTAAPDTQVTSEDTSVAEDTTTPPDTALAEDTALRPQDTASADEGSTGDVQDPPGPSVRFIAIGDTGTGSQTQIQVGQAIGTVCQARGGCDFGLLLGDNFYDSGLESADDPRWQSYFMTPYGHLGFPFYAVLGNHDLGGDGLGLDLDDVESFINSPKAGYQIDYSQVNSQWIMPSEYYEVTREPVWLVGLNTTEVFFAQDDDQRQDVASWMSRAGSNWRIAFGHHPYISNGRHGNAGEYDGVGPVDIPVLKELADIARGQHVKEFMEDVVCGKFDVYICGHDHSRQDMVATCGTEFIVSGAGAKTTDIETTSGAHYTSDLEGFLLIEANAKQLDIYFFDANGVEDHHRVLTRP